MYRELCDMANKLRILNTLMLVIREHFYVTSHLRQTLLCFSSFGLGYFYPTGHFVTGCFLHNSAIHLHLVPGGGGG